MSNLYKCSIFSFALLTTVVACSEKPGENEPGQTDAATQNEQTMPPRQEEQARESSKKPGQTIQVQMYHINSEGMGQAAGVIQVKETPFGTLFMPDLKDLSPGVHGFHIHKNPDCGPGEENGEMKPGLAAGPHYDPKNTGRHEGPYGDGHLGDLPPLYVTANGTSSTPVLAPRVELEDVNGHALIVHAGGDNFSDTPEPNGGGGARVLCGIANATGTGGPGTELSPPLSVTPSQTHAEMPARAGFLPWHFRKVVL